MGAATVIKCAGKHAGILLAAVIVFIAGDISRADAQGGIPPIQGGRVWLGPPTQRPPVVPDLVDATPLLEEAHRRLAALMRRRGMSVSRRAPGQGDTYSVGDREKFWAIDFDKGVGFPYTQYEVEAECRVVGEYAYYFVEVEELTTVKDEHIQELVTAFEDSTSRSPRDSSKGIYEHVTEVFGDVPDVDGDPKIVILLTSIPQAAYAASGTSFFAGYFYGVNQSLDDPVDFGGGVKQRSNKTEMLYVNSKYVAFEDPDPAVQEEGRAFVKSTVAHEFQHLIHYGNDELEIVAINEGLSEYASFICGYGLRYIANYVSRPNVDMFSWRKYGDTLDDYSRMALWTYYLGNRLGDDFIRAFATDPMSGLAGLNSALAGFGSLSFDEIFNDFLTALYLEGRVEGDSRFDTGSLIPWVEPQVHENLHPSLQRVTLEPYGAVVLRYWNGSDMTIELPEGLPSGISARVALKGDGLFQVSDLTASGTVVAGLGTTYREAGVILTNGSGSRSQTFRVTASATQGDSGMVKYENGRPFLRIVMPETWYIAVRITPEVTPAKITGVWVFFYGSSPASIAVRTMTANPSLPGTWIVNEIPIFSATVTPGFHREGWLYVPIPDIGTYTAPGVEYLVSMSVWSNIMAYSDLTRDTGRSFLNRMEGLGWEPLSNFGIGDPPTALDGGWMFRAEFTYQDTTAPAISLAMLQHPLFPAQADVYVMGNEPLHPGASSGTLTEGSGSPIELIFERTLGAFSLVDPTPVLLDAGQIALSVEAFDRYGGLSATASLPVSITRFGTGEPASLMVVDDGGVVVVDIPPGGHSGTTLVMIPYDAAPAGLSGGPEGATSVLGAPVVSLGPAGWNGPSQGSRLHIPVRGRAGPGEEFRFERWNGEEWNPVPGGASIGGGEAVGRIPGGGWYRLARGSAPSVPGTSDSIELLGNAPNPFNPQTVIRFRISQWAAGKRVRLTVINVRGQLVKTLIDRPMGSGEQRVSWYGNDDSGQPVSSGIYLYRLEADGTVLTRKMLLLR